MMKKEKYKFDLAFQYSILASMIGDASFMSSSAGVLHPEYFDDEILQGVAEAALSFWEEYGKCPDAPGLVEEVKKFIAPGRKLVEYKDTIRKLMVKVGTNNEYYQSQARQFARRQAVIGAIRKSIEIVESGDDEDLDEIVNTVQLALSTGKGSEKIADFFSGVEARAKKYNKARKHGGNPVREGVITSGVEEINQVMGGGLGKGELGLIVAPPKHGKSTMLINLGASAVLAGKTVLHVSLELREKMLTAKYDSRFMGRSLINIQKRPKSFLLAMKKIQESLKSKLYIKEFPTKSLSISELRYVAQSIEGLDMIIIDYADLMRARKNREELRFELRELYEDLRGLAGTLGVPIWTASQSSRPSIGQKVVRMEHISEAMDKIAISDVGISLCQTAEEAEDGKIRLFVMGSRIGPSNVEAVCSVNWESSLIGDLPDEEL